MKYYNFCLFHKVERNFIAQSGDPTATGRGGESIFSVLYGSQAKYFEAELKPRMKHEKLGTLSMVNNGGNMNGSQFFLTLGENLTYLDEVHTVFGEVAEGHEVLLKINEIICDQNNRPYQDIRITHTVILHDPYDDPAGLSLPDASPEPTKEMLETDYIAPDEELDDTKGKDIEEIEERIKDSEAKARATILEMVGDIPDADVRPPENVLFVCKLNPVTTSEDLETIFSRFGKVLSCEVIKDKKSGESLQYAFVEYEEEKECENAFFKMDNVLIDDRRIHVDFSQSVAKLNWNQNKVGRGKPGRFQNFVMKGESKKSDGYEMIFDTNVGTGLPRRKENKRHQEKSRDAKSHRSSRESYTDKYSSRTRDKQVLDIKLIKKKHRRSPSPVKSSGNTKEYQSRSSRKSRSTSPRSHHKSTSFSRTSDYHANKNISRKRSYSSGSSSSPEKKSKATTHRETYSKDKYYQKSKHSDERSYPTAKTKNKRYDYVSKPTIPSGNRRDYHARSESSPLKSNRDRSASSDNNIHSSSSSSSKHQKHSKSSKKSSRKGKQKTSSSDSSSSDEYVSKKSSKFLEPVGRNYEKSSKHSSHIKTCSPQYSKSKNKASSDRRREEKKKYSEQNKCDSRSSDSDSYASQSKSSKLNSSNYKYSEKLHYRKRSSS